MMNHKILLSKPILYYMLTNWNVNKNLKQTVKKEVTADEMKYNYLNYPLHSLIYPAEILLWQKSIDAGSSRVSAFPWKAKSSNASKNTLTYQRTSRISVARVFSTIEAAGTDHIQSNHRIIIIVLFIIADSSVYDGDIDFSQSVRLRGVIVNSSPACDSTHGSRFHIIPPLGEPEDTHFFINFCFFLQLLEDNHEDLTKWEHLNVHISA